MKYDSMIMKHNNIIYTCSFVNSTGAFIIWKINSSVIWIYDYVKFMREYESLNHMAEVSPDELGNNYYVIPHHAVRNPDSSTTKFRVVFDASGNVVW